MRQNADPARPIAVHRPSLPAAEALLPYLRRIDANRWYSNMGPLVVELAERLEDRFGTPRGSVHPVANATLGLTLALLALTDGRPGLCLHPAWTFVATAHAARLAGLTPFLADVDAASQQLTPALARAALAAAPGPVAAVVAVGPHGAPVDWDGWRAFRAETGVPVVVDAAAGFDSVRVGDVPAVVSLHATKALGVGEGGLVCCADGDLIAQVVRRANFGFLGSRDALVVGTNAKMSEYHAAVGLAALDAWADTRAAFARVQTRLAAALAGRRDVRCPPGCGESWVSSTFCVQVTAPLEPLMRDLAEAGIETRRWWGGGVHSHAAFARCPRLPLPVTDALAASTLGLPCSRDQDDAACDRVAALLLRALERCP